MRHILVSSCLLGVALSASLTPSQMVGLATDPLFHSQHYREPSDAVDLKKGYDFIIVGAGTAGSIVANRLTENPDWDVLLIEAGQPENALLDVPGLYSDLLNSATNWEFVGTVSENYCRGQDIGTCRMHQGKVMGGSSTINARYFMRGSQPDYDQWAANGNEGWSWNDTQSYFEKSDKMLSFEEPAAADDLEFALQEAGSAVYGLLNLDDPVKLGFGRKRMAIKNGTRISSNRAYLHPIFERSNLHVIKNSQVSKVNIRNGRASSVLFHKSGEDFEVTARKEVVLSTGAINTPKLLLLSGIAPIDSDIEALGIKRVATLSVGRNLQDHVGVSGLIFESNYTFPSYDIDAAYSIFMANHSGPLSDIGGSFAFIDLAVDGVMEKDGVADIEFIYTPFSGNASGFLSGYSSAVSDDLLSVDSNVAAFTIVPRITHPYSRGSVKLATSDWRDKPLVDLNYFNDSRDVDVILAGMYEIMNLGEHPVLQKFNVTLRPYALSACGTEEDAASRSKDYWSCFARYMTIQGYHVVGTAKMGPPEDAEAVVDPRLRVYGIEGLRVVDASIIPQVIAGHLESTILMLAEKASDMIKEDHFGDTTSSRDHRRGGQNHDLNKINQKNPDELI